MIDSFLRALRQPEYVHVLLNPLPVYGLLVSWIGLIAALISKSRRALIVTLILVFITSLSAWPVYEFGEEGYDRVLAMTDDDGHAWLDEHQDRAQKLIYLFYSFQCHQLPQRSFFLFGPQLTYSIEQINTARGSEI